ncbi:MAG TPA: AAA family ATPase [Solirubrobacteraceae bacterium]|jgi:chromosome segregation protein|nr:AAA family ATPase [Solirubrobacteraceae bacterium]
MHLKSLTMKGFKSFPDRTKLDFGPGVSVVVGPNGSGKSNVTDALLWAMGEQSPLAIRGQSMQDVIFGGGRGVQARSAAEVEIVLDNSDETVDLPLSEISIVRRLDRSGDGEYRLNGARARLVDVIEVLSDTGLGKETHSVISQGRVEAIVTSKPRDRRLLIEEAAGLGKHRKRRRRAQLKLERTQENLDRALDVEREARTRLRPLKRQAEAAELHERLEHQMLQARFELAREAVRARRVQLVEAEEGVRAARAAREQIESRLRAVVERRGRAESALAERTERHDALSRRVYEARSARERLQMRGEQAAAAAATLAQRASRIEIELGALEQGPGEGSGEHGELAQEQASVDRVRALETALVDIDSERERELEREIEGLEREREQAAARVTELEARAQGAREAREQADALAEAARVGLRKLEGDAEAARREAAKVGAELAAANQFLRSHAGAHGAKAGAPRALSDALQVKPGYELALAAALGGRLDAALVRDMDGARTLLDGVGPDGGAALLAGEAAGESDGPVGQDAPAGQDGGGRVVVQEGDDRSTEPAGKPPAADALRLTDLLGGSGPVLTVAHRLLADAWVVERLEDVAEDFRGVASTASGRVLFAGWGELRQVTEGGAERVLARRNERDRLIADSEQAVVSEHAARAAVEQALEQAREANLSRDQADGALRDSERLLGEAAEAQRKAAWLIEQRKAAPEQGPLAVRRAELQGELAAERRQAERRQAERAERARRIERLRAQRTADLELMPRAERLATVLAGTGEAMTGLLQQIEALLSEDRAAGEQVSAELRACAQEEAEIQAALRVEGEAVTGAEVAAQRLRDQAAEAQEELREVCERLELPVPGSGKQRDGENDLDAPEGEHADGPQDAPVGHPPASVGEPALEEAEIETVEPLGEEQEQALRSRLERLARRREQLGPVNPLAQDEYAEAVAHVEELEERRTDLETALRELRAVIRETDRQIHETFNETFSAAARNFEELVGDVFPGGSGRLRLVKDEQAPRAVLGGEPAPENGGTPDAEAAAEIEADADELEDAEEMMGVEIEITPAGKSTKRLSLLSGGEKSMTALAFMFSVFLARPCPFYVLDEVEAALDDLNLDRFLTLLRRYSDRAQFIVITHQKRTMEAADWLYGVSMADNGVSKVLSRRLPKEEPAPQVAAVEDPPRVAPVA